jgi:hypothetical protein
LSARIIHIPLSGGDRKAQARGIRYAHGIHKSCYRESAEQSIADRERYVGYATHCLQLAKATADRESRAILKEMATEWLKLAEALAN